MSQRNELTRESGGGGVSKQLTASSDELPLRWIDNPAVIREMNDFYSGMLSQDVPIDWECRVADAMVEKNMPRLEPEAWIDCQEVVKELNDLYRSVNNLDAPDSVEDWECRVANALYKFIH